MIHSEKATKLLEDALQRFDFALVVDIKEAGWPLSKLSPTQSSKDARIKITNGSYPDPLPSLLLSGHPRLQNMIR